MPLTASHGPQSRAPVFHGTRRVRGLYQRQLASGQTIYEARLGKEDRRVRLDATTKTEAIAELEALRTDRRRGVPAIQTGRGVVTVAEVAGEYVEHLEARVGHRDPARRFSPRTVALYRQRLRDLVLPSIGGRRVDLVDVQDLRRMVDRLGQAYAPGTVTSALNITSGLLRYAVKQGYTVRNVVRDLDRDDRPGSRRQTEPRYLDADQVEHLLAALGDTFRPIAATCGYAGLRISEALGLRWADVDFDAGTLRVEQQLDDDLTTRPETKSAASTATVGMVPALERELRAWRQRQAAGELRHGGSRAELVFTTMRGRPQSRRNALRAVHHAGTQAGLNVPGAPRVGLHDLRHSLIGLGLAGGLTIAEVAELARHANAGVTATMYAGLSETGRAGVTRRLVESGFGG